MTPGPGHSAFSKKVPLLQLALDSTSLGEFKTCPRKYYYRILRGKVPRQTSIDLTFGILLHKAMETYQRRRADAASHDDALDATVEYLLRATWDSAAERPLIIDDPVKNRVSLLRAVVWYLTAQHEAGGDALKTVILSDGRPAVELPFEFDTGFETRDGEKFILCGHLDRLCELGGQLFDEDYKTTKYSLDAKFFAQFSPHNQMTIYTIAGKVAFRQPLTGVIINGFQIGAGFVRHLRSMIQYSDSQLREWLQGLGFWLRRLEECARRDEWPQNEMACSMYRGCDFRGICSKSPESREQWLDAEFATEFWNPLDKRGEI